MSIRMIEIPAPRIALKPLTISGFDGGNSHKPVASSLTPDASRPEMLKIPRPGEKNEENVMSESLHTKSPKGDFMQKTSDLHDADFTLNMPLRTREKGTDKQTIQPQTLFDNFGTITYPAIEIVKGSQNKHTLRRGQKKIMPNVNNDNKFSLAKKTPDEIITMRKYTLGDKIRYEARKSVVPPVEVSFPDIATIPNLSEAAKQIQVKVDYQKPLKPKTTYKEWSKRMDEQYPMSSKVRTTTVTEPSIAPIDLQETIQTPQVNKQTNGKTSYDTDRVNVVELTAQSKFREWSQSVEARVKKDHLTVDSQEDIAPLVLDTTISPVAINVNTDSEVVAIVPSVPVVLAEVPGPLVSNKESQIICDAVDQLITPIPQIESPIVPTVPSVVKVIREIVPEPIVTTAVASVVSNETITEISEPIVPVTPALTIEVQEHVVVSTESTVQVTPEPPKPTEAESLVESFLKTYAPVAEPVMRTIEVADPVNIPVVQEAITDSQIIIQEAKLPELVADMNIAFEVAQLYHQTTGVADEVALVEILPNLTDKWQRHGVIQKLPEPQFFPNDVVTLEEQRQAMTTGIPERVQELQLTNDTLHVLLHQHQMLAQQIKNEDTGEDEEDEEKKRRKFGYTIQLDKKVYEYRISLLLRAIQLVTRDLAEQHTPQQQVIRLPIEAAPSTVNGKQIRQYMPPTQSLQLQGSFLGQIEADQNILRDRTYDASLKDIGDIEASDEQEAQEQGLKILSFHKPGQIVKQVTTEELGGGLDYAGKIIGPREFTVLKDAA